MKKKDKIKAAAIKYSKENLNVPIVAALGSGELAERIIEEANKNGIEIVKNQDFFDFEDLFKPGKEIPFEVYRLVVDILAYILNTTKKDNK